MDRSVEVWGNGYNIKKWCNNNGHDSSTEKIFVVVVERKWIQWMWNSDIDDSGSMEQQRQ